MPIYDYQCQECGETTEVLQGLSDPPLEECPRCKGAVRKRPSAPAFQFKGTGWYVTDYARKDREGSVAAEKGADGDGGADAKSRKEGTAAGKKDDGSGEGKTATKKADPPSVSLVAMLGLALLWPIALGAQELGPAFRTVDVAAQAVVAAPSYLGESAGVAPLARLEPAATVALAQLEEMAAWNRGGGGPLQDGFARPLPRPQIVTLSAGLLEGELPRAHAGGMVDLRPGGELVWTARIDVEDAFGFRIGLSEVELPPGTRFWVYRPGELVERAYGRELVDPRGNLWLPPVEDETAWLEVAVPTPTLLAGARHGFVVREVAELFQLDARGKPVAGRHLLALDNGDDNGEEEDCAVDSGCVDQEGLPGVDLFRSAVARLQFMKGGSGFLCTGTLLNNTAEDFTPLLLTANHCFSTQESASSLNARFDFHSSVCDGPVEGGTVQVMGSTLLATGEETDFTLVQLSEIPPGDPRGFMGWNASLSALADGAVLHRFHQPGGGVQGYSRGLFRTSGPFCSAAPRNRFLYSELEFGSTVGGSSGSAVFLGNGQVVGQLLGACGPSPQEECDRRNHDIDGALHATFPKIAQWLDPVVQEGPCEPDETTMCLHGERFRLEVEWRSFEGETGIAKVVPFGSNDSGLFWFFEPDNWEMLVKVLAACGINDRFWVFAAATTDVEYTLRVTDTETGVVWQESNPLGQASSAITDTDAFATCL